MPKLPVISGKELIKKLERQGYIVIRQKGSHVRLKNNDPRLKPLTVPTHKFIKPGLLHKIIRDANMTLEDFLNI
ncbi:MAG: type II toxin-antitoxin system HicA family toxin [Parcubacteria group bacterium]|jgi:predicted RNA binding protein YcfA (HicA-like mRNA interferase family)